MTENQEQSPAPAEKPHRRRRWWRLLWLIPTVPLALVVLVVVLLYIPGVLNRIGTWVLPKVEDASGMHIEVADMRLRFPLTLRVEDAVVIQRGDTMLTLRRADVSVNPMPLIAGKVKVSDAVVRDAFYQMGGADSLYIGARIDSVGAAAVMNLSFSEINVKHADVDGARVLLLMGTDTTETPKDTTATKQMLITSGPLSLRNIDYRMSMASSGDTIAAAVTEATLSEGRLLVADTIDIKAGVLQMALSHGLYGKIGAEPVAGLDLNWLELTRGAAMVDSFAMHGSALRVPLRRLTLTERCGLNLSGSGVFEMDSTMLAARGFKIRANSTSLTLDAVMGLDSVAAKAPVVLKAAAKVMPADVLTAMPALLPALAPLPEDVPLLLGVDAHGTMARLTVDTVSASMERIFALSGAAYVENLNDMERLKADASLSGSMTNPAPVNAFLPKGSGLRVPPLSLKAKATADGNSYTADLTARTGSGRLALKGALSGNAPAYNANLRLDSFPVAAFMPDLGIGTVSGTVKASGRGFNPMARGAKLNAEVDVRSLTYKGDRLGGLNLTARLDTALLTARLTSTMAPARMKIDLSGHLRPKVIDWNLDGDIANIDLKALRMSDSIMGGSLRLVSSGFMVPGQDSINAVAAIRNLNFDYGKINLQTDSLGLKLLTGKALTEARAGNRGMDLKFDAQASLSELGNKFGTAATLAQKMVESRIVYADTLADALPQFNLSLSAGPDNLINDYLRPQHLSFGNLNLTARRDSIINLDARVLSFRSGESLKIDTITASVRQYGPALTLDIDMDNRRGTFDEFAHVCLAGKWDRNRGDFNLKQSNIEGETGYRIGFGLETEDSVITLTFNPLDPVIAYKDWTINEGNFLSFNMATKRIQANLIATGSDSRLKLASHRRPVSETDSTAIDDLTLRIDNVHLQDWLKINPFAPPIAGDASANISLIAGESSLNGQGTLSLENLTYGKQRVGDIDLNLDVKTGVSGFINATVNAEIDGKPALTAHGVMNDTTRTDPMAVDLRVIDLPLKVANPFLPKEYASLSGSLTGEMAVTGKFNAPVMNGAIRFRDARVKVGMIGSSFTFDSVDVPVDSNLVRFNRFAITGSNANPLYLDGSVNMRNFSSPRLNINLNARNMQIINSKKGKTVNVYGKAFIDLDANVRGSMQFLNVDAQLALLPQTNVTYVVESAGASSIGLQNDNDMVRFVNFADTAATIKADTIAAPSMMMSLNALLDIRQGSTVTVDLSADGQNRAQIKGEGILDYTMTPTQPDGRLTGRFTINSGFFRYSLPVISEKNFSFNQGSYVAFNGPILNPTLSIHATDDVKANVTRSGENSRLVVFDVILNVTGTLERMDVAFDLETNDDITVQNELKSMSPTQRANQAMNLMLYGVYTGQGTTGNANLSGNVAFSFLTSQLNTWAANSIKGVDLSFGMDQYDRTRDGSTSTATQYSYQLSKSLFNDRFKIVVGGNYSTDANAEENLAQNLISDISFEYLLNDAGSMYVRLFRHTGYESILEGEVTQTGVGFVMRRKVSRLGDLFIFRKTPKK